MCEKMVISSEEEGLVEVEADESRSKRRRTEKHAGFLPEMVLRVLLVEADDSTRQIITALLRKCRYKVMAVPDGLKAWEILKEKPQSIDIVLTEVELPSISGFSLLTLVMEHDVCKNIPIIMMSSHDSISMVLKCMLKGAADFLIKPVRKNELRILWQHVWRRHSLTGGCIPQNLSVTQQNVEAGTENNTVSNHSSDYVFSHQDRDSSKIVSDAQGVLQPKGNSTSYLSNCDTEKHEECTKLTKELVNRASETEERPSKFGTEVAPCNEADNSFALRLEKDSACAKGTALHACTRSDNTWNGNIKSEINCSSDEPLSKEIDLIGTFDDNRAMCSHVHSSSVNCGSNKVECTPQLELSFRPSSLKGDESGERRGLNHSNASAFSWYNNTKILQPPFPTQGGNITKLEQSADKILYLSPYHCTVYSTLDNNGMALITGQSGQTERAFPSVSVPGLRYFHVLPSLLYTKSDTCQLQQSPSVCANSEMNGLKQGYHVSDETLNKDDNNLEAGEVLRYDIPCAGQSCDSSSFCNGVVSELNGSVHESTCSTSRGTEKANALESDDLIGTGGRRASQREAALAKFRLKRKERCYDKKVRYESRQRVAEQQPRVKGQFVRQGQSPGARVDGNPQES